MSALPKPRKLTTAEYFAFEEASPVKHEFHDGELFAMAGANREHNVIGRNLAGHMFAAMQSGPCQLFLSDQRLEIGLRGTYVYPDMLIVCEKPEYAAANRNTLTNPKVVIEILSDSTERYDRTTKFRFYKAIPSVQEYVLVSQGEPLIESYVRRDDGTWTLKDFVGLDATLELQTVAASVSMAAIYADVEFPQTAIQPMLDEPEA